MKALRAWARRRIAILRAEADAGRLAKRDAELRCGELVAVIERTKRVEPETPEEAQAP